MLALVACGLVVLWQGMQAAGKYSGNWSGFFYVDTRSPLPAPIDSQTWRHPAGGNYDGQYYRLIALDPLPPFAFSSFVDAPSMRYRRILVPLAAWLGSFGNPVALSYSFAAVIALSVFFGVLWSARSIGILFLALPAVISSVDRFLVDATLAACVAGMVHFRKGPWWGLWCLAAAAALTRETGCALAVALALTTRQYWRYGSALLPALCWWGVVFKYEGWGRALTGAGFLPTAILDRLFHPRPGLVLVLLDTIALVGLILVLVLALRWFWGRWDDPSAVAGLLFLLEALSAGSPVVMSDPYAWGRVFSPLLLLFMIEAAKRRFWAGIGAALAIASTPFAYSVHTLYSILRT